MKKIFILLSCFCVALSGFSQSELPSEIEAFWGELLAPSQGILTSSEKVVDSIIFLRIDASSNLSLEKQNIFLYDTLARQTREFNSSFDINADSLFYVDQTNTTYSQNQIVESKGRIEQGQYQNTGRITEDYRDQDVLLTTFGEIWDAGTNSFLPSSLSSNYFIGTTNLVDSLLTQTWDAGTQDWVPSRLDLQFYGNDLLRDSVYSYTWNSTANLWNLIGKFTSFYDPLGQQTNLNIYNWDSSISGFSLQLEIFEFYNGDALKDSAHVYSYFGGYYGENYTIFTYENDLVIADTIYTWDATQNELLLTNYQSYAYDSDGDLVEQKTYAYNAVQDIFTQVTQANYFYSLIELTTVSLQSPIPSNTECKFINPYIIGSDISCSLENPEPILGVKVYDLQGKLLLHKKIQGQELIRFAIEKHLVSGLYILSLENSSGEIGHHKLLVNTHQ